MDRKVPILLDKIETLKNIHTPKVMLREHFYERIHNCFDTEYDKGKIEETLVELLSIDANISNPKHSTSSTFSFSEKPHKI